MNYQAIVETTPSTYRAIEVDANDTKAAFDKAAAYGKVMVCDRLAKPVMFLKEKYPAGTTPPLPNSMYIVIKEVRKDKFWVMTVAGEDLHNPATVNSMGSISVELSQCEVYEPSMVVARRWMKHFCQWRIESVGDGSEFDIEDIIQRLISYSKAHY